jgi:AcrR family transcriptional regulator
MLDCRSMMSRTPTEEAPVSDADAHAPASGHLPAPIGDPQHDLPPVARAILEAAQTIVVDRGFGALTLNAIAAESGENKAMVSYYFGNKAGLVAAMLEAIIHDECLAIAAQVEGTTGEERLHRLLQGICAMTLTPGFYRGFFDILPHAMRDPALRPRLIALYEWYIAVELGWLGVPDESDPERRRKLRGLAQLIAAAIDGLGLQARIDRERFDVAQAYDVLELLLRNSWREFAPQ